MEVLLVHPGGPFWIKKDSGAWTIPKGELNENEYPFNAAIREMKEETGIILNGNFIELTPVKQKGGKLVCAWANEQDIDPSEIKSNEFEIEWPPKSGKKKSFPDIPGSYLAGCTIKAAACLANGISVIPFINNRDCAEGLILLKSRCGVSIAILYSPEWAFMISGYFL